jgi:hypothetical protein
MSGLLFPGPVHSSLLDGADGKPQMIGEDADSCADTQPLTATHAQKSQRPQERQAAYDQVKLESRPTIPAQAGVISHLGTPSDRQAMSAEITEPPPRGLAVDTAEAGRTHRIPDRACGRARGNVAIPAPQKIPSNPPAPSMYRHYGVPSPHLQRRSGRPSDLFSVDSTDII